MVGSRDEILLIALRPDRVRHFGSLKCTGVADPQVVCLFVPFRTEQREFGCHQYRTPDARGGGPIEAGVVSIKLNEPYLLK